MLDVLMIDVLDGLDRAIDEVFASEQLLDLPRLRRLADRLEAAFLQEVRKADQADRVGDTRLSPAGGLAASCRMGFGRAKAALDLARKLAELPVTRDAVNAASITPEHARVITSAYTSARAEQLRELEPQLVECAAKFWVRDLRLIVGRVCDAIDGDGGAADAQEKYEARHLHVSHAFERVGVVTGQLDPEGTEYVLSALEKRMEDDQDCAGDKKRTPSQRRADALVDICRHYLECSEAPDPRRRRGQPHIGAILDLALLRNDGHVDLADQIRGELAHVGAVCAETLRRLSCDAKISRIITDGDSMPLDIGRATRTIPPAIWLALVARDGHCQHPGCTVPAAWCDGHHVWHWEDGGPTALWNLKLYCRLRHHREQHEGKAKAQGP
ncbi:MAG TPA: DUF222 domain-containing protein [Acidimicrobiia bacterium]|jgi:hypothetical protein|nr:DUF222 domain-containing protein [Acidimicrobiia bacterium]